MDEFSRIETKVYMSPFKIGIAIDMGALATVTATWKVVFREFRDVLSADHVRFDPSHPYINHPTV